MIAFALQLHGSVKESRRKETASEGQLSRLTASCYLSNAQAYKQANIVWRLPLSSESLSPWLPSRLLSTAMSSLGDRLPSLFVSNR